MAWLRNGQVAACDTCKRERWVVEDRDASIQLLRAAGWHHMKGRTQGGVDFESLVCPECGKGERRRPRAMGSPEQDTLPLDFEKGRIVGGKQGVSSR